MRKLVLLDEDGWLTEVCPIALKRDALTLKALIDSASPQEAELLHYQDRLVPLIEMALNGTIEIPYKFQPYLYRLIDDGIEPEIPPRINEAYCQFMCRIEGADMMMLLSPEDEDGPGLPKIFKDGKFYQWVEFEDPPLFEVLRDRFLKFLGKK